MEIKKDIEKMAKLNVSKFKQYCETENLEKLHNIKLYADDMYFNTGIHSGLEDLQYDVLKEILFIRDPEYTVPIGARIRQNENRVKLPYWLGSMDKITLTSIGEEAAKQIESWKKNNKSMEYVIESKLDGVSCLLAMKNGKIKLYTRGDGVYGADISYLSQYFDTIPKNLDVTLFVRGELIMKIDTFKKKYADTYANPRNMVAGRIGAKTVREGLNDISFVAYEILGDGMMEKPTDQLDYLDSLGFTTVHSEIVDNLSIENITDSLIRNKNISVYEIDGVIVQPNLSYERNVSGNPEYAFAFKMRVDGVITEVLEVEWHVSKWGLIKPVVHIKPISIGGVTIKQASGFNAKYITDNMIGIGAMIEVVRSGDVIPFIVKTVKPALEPDMPDMLYKWNETGVDIITEEYGDEMCIKLIASFFAKLGIKQVGEQNVKKLYNSGYDSLLKIINASKEDLEKVPGFGARLAERTYDNIHTGLKKLSLPVVLGASGIFGFGMGIKKITTLLDDFPDILQKYKSMSKSELFDKISHVQGFSDKTTQKIVDNIEWADKFVIALKIFGSFEEKIVISDNMKGMKVVFTGFRDEALEKDVVARGGKIATSVSSNTTVLVVSAKTANPSGKMKKALDIGVEVLTKEEFIEKYIQ